MRLLIAEKPFIVRLLQEHNLIPHDTEIVFTFGFGLWRFTLPKISFKDIPFTETPSALRPHSFNVSRYLITATGKAIFSHSENATGEERNAILDNMVKYLRERMSVYDEIICAVDPDRTGYGAARQLLDQINPDFNSPVPVNCLYLLAMDEQSLRTAWEARASNPWTAGSRAQSLADKQLAKQTFDYWWNANSSLVLSVLCHWTNLKGDPLISKYELMLLAVIAATPEITINKLLTTMENWKGTGKYRDSGLYGGIGSTTSRLAILDSAVARGMVLIREGENPNRQTCSLTAPGMAFMNRLHPRTFDPDLPFRLEQWIATGDYNSMRRYINTVFSRQLRYQRNQLKCSITQKIITALQQQLGVSCLIQTTPDDDQCSDLISLISSADSQLLGTLNISAFSGGMYRLKFVSGAEKNEFLVHADGGEEQGGMSVQDFSPAIGRIIFTKQ